MVEKRCFLPAQPLVDYSLVSSISRRIEKSFECFHQDDIEGSLIHLFPAIDKVAKRRRPRAGVGKRIRAFIADEEVMITGLATNNVWIVNINGKTLPEVIYKYGRCSIVHEGELDSRIKFNDQGHIALGEEWDFPQNFVLALILAVVVAPESASERINDTFNIAAFSEGPFPVNDLWGQREFVRDLMRRKWRNENLFD